MQFDRERYRENYIKPKVKQKVVALPDDLVERYALTLPAIDADIAAQIRAVRGFWNSQTAGTPSAKICKLCITEDERLKAAHGDDMLRAPFWKKRAEEGKVAAEAAASQMSELLAQQFGSLGVITASILESYASTLGVDESAALTAAGHAGLAVVSSVRLPEDPPIKLYDSFETSLAESGVKSVPELLHPGSGSFKILEKYVSLSDPRRRLDGESVGTQLAQAERLGASAGNDARRKALDALRTALRANVDLRSVSLYHLAKYGERYVSLGPTGIRGELMKVGLEADDAAVIAVVLSERKTAAGARGLARVQSMLDSGQLNEARQAAQSLPSESEHRPAMLAKVEEARARLDALLAQAAQALAVPDEVRAASLLREAELISVDDATLAMAAVPLAPPTGLRLASDGEVVRLHWQPTTGHVDGTSYLISRSAVAPPQSPAEGTSLGKQSVTTIDDSHSPVARTVHYSVFAVMHGRPASRAASASIMLLPPVIGIAADVGPSDITVHWSTHPAVHSVQAVRRDPGLKPVPLRVSSNSCYVGNLPEGQAVHFEVTALYRGPDGSELRSAVASINATPRSEARPITRLRANPVDVSGQVRVRVAWKPVDSSDVHILRSGSASPWTPGTWVSADEMAQYGIEVTGRTSSTSVEHSIEAELPSGVHHLVPFSIGGTGIVVGKGSSVGVTDPVTNLIATPFADFAKLSWVWPANSLMAEVTWELDNDADIIRVGHSEYQAQGVQVPLGRGPCRVEVRSLIIINGASFTSPPVSLVVDRVVEAAVSYTVSSSPGVGRFGGRNKKVTFVSAEGCSDVHVRMVALPGRVMPLSAEGAFVILDATLNLAAGTPVVHAVAVPSAIRRPFWVRCFIVRGYARLTDPPLTHLKDA